MNRILIGDVLTGMAQLPDGCVQTCVTSPPYYGLRDYGTGAWIGGDPDCDHAVNRDASGTKDSPARQSSKSSKSERLNRTECRCGAVRKDDQIGLEQTPDEFIGRMVGVFREVRRVLRADGTIWVNMGDSYAGSGGQSPMLGDAFAGRTRQIESVCISAWAKAPGVKPKDLMGIPWMLAFALRADGWYLRQDIIWHKPNPMPESVTDRCTKAHEYVFLLSKSERYLYDAEAVKEPVSGGAHARLPGNVAPPKGQAEYERGATEHRTKAGLLAFAERMRNRVSGGSATKTNGVGFGHGYDKTTKPRARKLAAVNSGTKNNGSFDAAMQVMPDTRNRRSVWTIPTQAYKEAHFATFPEALVEPCILAGSRPGDLVLDPFMGSGTTAVVAQRLGRNWVGCELNPKYAAMAERRIRNTQPGLALA